MAKKFKFKKGAVVMLHYVSADSTEGALISARVVKIQGEIVTFQLMLDLPDRNVFIEDKISNLLQIGVM